MGSADDQLEVTSAKQGDLLSRRQDCLNHLHTADPEEKKGVTGGKRRSGFGRSTKQDRSDDLSGVMSGDGKQRRDTGLVKQLQAEHLQFLFTFLRGMWRGTD